MNKTVVVVGGGAAGFFAALACKRANPHIRVIIIEKMASLLSKVRVSGGGRCNVTHHCFDVMTLVQHYPRGQRELRQAFHQFQPKDTVQWFLERNVPLKVEADGRMFPTTDTSETIIQCFLQEAEKHGVEIITQCDVLSVEKKESVFAVTTSKEIFSCDALLIASGSSKKMLSLVEHLGHTIEPQVPSLFTFTLPGSPLLALAGVSVADVAITCEGITQRGPVLITHWGLSGPCVLKLSAWAARELHEKSYKTEIVINWLPAWKVDVVIQALEQMKQQQGAKNISSDNPFSLPKNLWKLFVSDFSEKKWATLSKSNIQQLACKLTRDQQHIDGKTTYKEEFVTCGGVRLREVDFKTMESKVVPNLYFAGEVLDIDGITGGFNFQNAWTTGWIAGYSIAQKSHS